MEKTAQKRGLVNKLREFGNAPGRSLKKVFDPEYGELMDKLKATDNTLRSITVGESIDGAEPGDDPVALKTLIKDARSRFNRREYLVAASLLGRVHKKFDDIVKEAKSFKMDFEKVHNRFLFAPFEDTKDKKRDEHIEHLRKLRQRLGTEPHPAYFIKEAGIWDTLSNVFTNRGRALAQWEKRYPQKVKAIRDSSNALLNQAENLQTRLLGTLKDMATARATNDLNGYVKLVESLSSKYFTDFDTAFKKYYAEQVKPVIDSQAMFKDEVPKAELSKDEAKETGKQEIDTSKHGPTFSGGYLNTNTKEKDKFHILPSPDKAVERGFVGLPNSPWGGTSGPASDPLSGGGARSQPTPPSSYPSSRPPSGPGTPPPSGSFAPAPGSSPSLPFNPTMPAAQWDSNTPTERTGPNPNMNSQEFLMNPVIPPPPRLPTNLGPANDVHLPSNDNAGAEDGFSVAAQHKQFFAVLNKLGNEDPLVVSAYVRKYAQSIQASDPETAIKLFGIAKRLKG